MRAMTDLIDRQAVVDVLDAMIAYGKTLDDAYWFIKDDAPSATPTAHWTNPLGNFTPFTCDHCGHMSDSKTPFCAWCGSRMEGYKHDNT